MREEGLLSDYGAFSVVHEALRTSPERAWNELVRRVNEFRPDVTLISRVVELTTSPSTVSDLRDAAEPGILVYEDLDPYGRLRARIPPSARLLARAADVVCISALGPLARQFRRAGARRIRFMPHGFDATRFGLSHVEPSPCSYDVAMIANRAPVGRFGVRLPGVRQRHKLARILDERHGERFALYGSGWDNRLSSRGPIDFDQQERVNRAARVTASWDNFPHLTFYSSNRVPIALAAGALHVTDYRPGYEVMFSGCPGLQWASTPEGVADAIDALLASSEEQLIEVRRATQRHAHEHLSQQRLYRALFQDLMRLQ